ncbi:MAG TPA: dihydrofolate reductase family protein [Solirubrobacteraceae bacterium]|nr:dihydrofolate reductase family protein [Solirubrobacteraceae bacterium]
MAKLIYSAITSLDGYVEDEHGRLEWAEPDEEVHAFVNELERPIGTYLYGRRMYETMVWWETFDAGPAQSAAARDYAELWQAADKIVYSRTLEVTCCSARSPSAAASPPYRITSGPSSRWSTSDASKPAWCT